MLKGVSPINAVVIAVTVLLFTVAYAIKVDAAAASKFKRVCAEAGGTTVWDGRQYQCIKASK